MGIPTLIQEQNSYAGVTNKLLAKKACKICVAYEGMERFFDKEKIILTGNPVRQNLLNQQMSREDAIRSLTSTDKENSLDCRRKFRSTHHQQLRTKRIGSDQAVWCTVHLANRKVLYQ